MSMFGRRPTVAGYWGTRVQSSQEVAQTMRAFLDDLEAIDPGLALPWVSTAEFDKVPADLSVDGLVRIFEHSRSKEMGYSDTPGPGYDIDLSPEDGTARRVGAWVGGLETSAPNSVLVSLPTETQLTDSTRRLLDPDIGDAIMRVIVKHWEPERARWSIGDYRHLQNRSKGEVEVGWETYFHSGVTFDRSALPQSAVVEDLPTGTLIRLGDKPMEVAAADIVAVRAALGYPV
ncbi:Imm52 family immunity protein [Rhodococcus erythropolis]